MMSRSTTYVLLSFGIFVAFALFFFSLIPSFSTGATATSAPLPNPCVGQVDTPPGCTGIGGDIDAAITACDTNCKTVCKAHEDIACSRAQCPPDSCTCARQSAIFCTMADDSCVKKYDEDGNPIEYHARRTCRYNGLGNCKATCAGTKPVQLLPVRG